jgi:hypothetical protein
MLYLVGVSGQGDGFFFFSFWIVWSDRDCVVFILSEREQHFPREGCVFRFLRFTPRGEEGFYLSTLPLFPCPRSPG